MSLDSISRTGSQNAEGKVTTIETIKGKVALTLAQSQANPTEPGIPDKRPKTQTVIGSEIILKGQVAGRQVNAEADRTGPTATIRVTEKEGIHV